MDINNYDYLLRNVLVSGLQVKAYEDKYERTDYMYCIENGLVYDKDLENYVNCICENKDIDLDDLKLYYKEKLEND